MNSKLLGVAAVVVVVLYFAVANTDINGASQQLRDEIVTLQQSLHERGTKLEASRRDIHEKEEDLQRCSHEKRTIEAREKQLKQEIGILRPCEDERQHAIELHEETKRQLKEAKESARLARQNFDQEKVVSQTLNKESAQWKAQYESTKADHDRLKVAAKAESLTKSDTDDKLANIEREKMELAAEVNKQKEQADQDAQRAKTLEEENETSKAEVARLRKEIKILEARVSNAKSISGLVKEELRGSDAKRKAILEADRRQKLESALDPTTARPIEAVTWNIAAINNNPFEYWISGTEAYNGLMQKIATFITEEPKEADVLVSEVFTPEMWADLKATMKQKSMNGVEQVDQMWTEDFQNRKVISGFLKDKSIGKKRLASMPDRVTNTITTTSGLLMRPTVINCFEGDLSSQEKWWKAWKDFMFSSEITVRKKNKKKTVFVFETLKTISRAKYPAVTPEEEKISIALQTLAAAIFDSTLVYLMNQAAPKVWEELRAEMCDKLNKGKNTRVVSILKDTYATSHAVFLQEVSRDFEKAAQGSGILKKFDIYLPEKADDSRGQNSVILLKKGEFGEAEEVTESVLKLLPDNAGVANGDLLVLTVPTKDGVPFLMASFHGDTNGLATKPVVEAVKNYSKTLDDVKLLFGMDGNTYDNPSDDQQGLADFAHFYRDRGLTTCYGDYPNPKNFTTFHARTHLQTQLNKAIAGKDKDRLGDKNPKDHIMFFKKDFIVLKTTKDNTGKREYIEGMVFPTLQFPSDHGITATTLRYPSPADLRRVQEDDRQAAVRALRSNLETLTWNIAAINNNPFEYWISGTEAYNSLMQKFAQYVMEPGEMDVPVSSVFTPEMWSELKTHMTAANMEGVDKVADLWEEKFKDRKIISGFLKDKSLGKKRLASMPDRVTNTIAVKGALAYRPTVINCYSGDLSSLAKWWKSWGKFMFQEDIEIMSKGGKYAEKKVYQILKQIRHAKYPEVTEEEEAVSFPLQTLAMAIFDAILVHLMNKAAPETWEVLRTEMCQSLNKGKDKRVVDIIATQYGAVDAAFLQEVSSSFQPEFSKSLLAETHILLTPEKADTTRNQNSVVLLRKALFKSPKEVTPDVLSLMKGDAPLVDGDLFALTAQSRVSGERYLFASFHGDTDGLATSPVIDAVSAFASSGEPKPRLVFGMDANSHAEKASGTFDVLTLSEHLKEKGLSSCYGDHPNPKNYTTFHARTHLQPQLNKGVFFKDRDAKGDKNPKDHILFDPAHFASVRTTKDNTGKREYIEGMVFPTLQFPSDHGITSALLQHRDRPALPPSREGELLVSTWNTAAVNNNPFEYWISGTDAYNELMTSFQEYITDPSEVDVPVSDIITDEMWEELRVIMTDAKMPGVSEVEDVWAKDLKNRKVVSEFLKDSSWGKKRLVSMPDRVTNTIVGAAGLLHRPTVINCYEGDLSSVEKWWKAWKNFMFNDKHSMLSKGAPVSKQVYTMLKQIPRDKYPALTEEEEAMSIPLQTAAAAVFDGVLVHLMNKASPQAWQDVRAEMCDKLNRNKVNGVAEILVRQYYSSDVVFLQEVGPRLLENPYIQAEFEAVVPEKFDADRKQNSVLLLKKHEWSEVAEITQAVIASVDTKAPVVDGDLLVASAVRHVSGVPVKYILASFHGDTNGLATTAVVDAVHKYASSHPESRVVFGMDANSYETASSSQEHLGVADFVTHLEELKMGTTHSKAGGHTTFNARTYLQPQINKAISLKERGQKADKNPKDHILFYTRQFSVESTSRDNTGRRDFSSDMVFPTLDFPSDHAVITALLTERRVSFEMKSQD
eukprot:TRINITY_DN30146_c0_g2_i4.p1 TRINITY_DN30146_c0_g2~~TRINITY_DN30146_c0_g2_i4.p1  ORF type:complete len:1794 (+),score=828.70 TRINITY_DN30146_c0_g2_i4:104-5485(+)